MTETKLNEITTAVRNALINHFDTDKYELIDLMTSIHNELYKEVTGDYYDYSYHWANWGYGGTPNDSLFKGGD